MTKVALDLARINTLSQAADHLAQALAAEMDSQADGLWQALPKRCPPGQTSLPTPRVFSFSRFRAGPRGEASGKGRSL